VSDPAVPTRLIPLGSSAPELCAKRSMRFDVGLPAVGAVQPVQHSDGDHTIGKVRYQVADPR
jgi:hypothetical protein